MERRNVRERKAREGVQREADKGGKQVILREGEIKKIKRRRGIEEKERQTMEKGEKQKRVQKRYQCGKEIRLSWLCKMFLHIFK